MVGALAAMGTSVRGLWSPGLPASTNIYQEHFEHLPGTFQLYQEHITEMSYQHARLIKLTNSSSAALKGIKYYFA